MTMRSSALRAQTKTEVVLTLRRGESVLLTLGIPVVLLVFFSIADVLPTPKHLDAVDFLFPGVLALAVMSAAMVGPAIATGFEREYGVLKRLAVTPLGRPALITAKIAAILAVEVVQVAALTVVAVFLGWDSHGAHPLTALLAVLVGTVAFAGLGLLLGGTLPGLTTLAAANGLYVLLLLVIFVVVLALAFDYSNGFHDAANSIAVQMLFSRFVLLTLAGATYPVSMLPGWLQLLSRMLPPASLSDLLHGALEPGGHVPLRAWLVLLAWAVGGPVIASRWFKWV